MAPSGRGRKSGTATTLSNGPLPLPPYQPPSNPLTSGAQRALNELHRTHRLDGLRKHLLQATYSLTTVAGDVNDRYYKKVEVHRRHKARIQDKKEGKDDEANGEALQEMRVMVDEMTGRLEESIRKTIDAKAAVDGIEVVLKELSANISTGGGPLVSTQSTLGASQMRQTKRQRDPDSDNEDSDGQEDLNPAHPLGMLKQKMTEYNSNYQNLSMREKYASNNDYIGFKKIVHDSRHPENDARPMPHASTWFPGSPSADDAAGGQHTADVDDDDLEVASERISIKCPLTLLPMQQPVSCRKCPHSFERAAILELLSASHLRGRGTGEKAMKCPVCEVMLTASDLYTDPVLVRKIARIQATGSDSDSESEAVVPRGTQRVLHQQLGSDDEGEGGDGSVSRAPRSSMQVKDEKVAGSAIAMVGGRRDREVSRVPATQFESGEDNFPASTAETMIVDLEDEEEEEEEEVGEGEEDNEDDE